MQGVDAGLGRLVVDLAGADIAVERGVGKAQVVFIGLAAQAVDGDLVYEHVGQAEIPANRLDLLDRQVRHGAEIAHGVAVAGGVADPVLREVAGVHHAAVETLGHGIDRCHADAGRQIDEALL